MCSLHLTHPSTHTHLEQCTHTPGAVDTHTHTHTHLEQWTHTHTHTPGAVDTHTHTHTWSSGGSSGEQSGVRCLAQGSHLSLGQFLPELRFEPTTSGYKSNALSIRPRLPLKKPSDCVVAQCFSAVCQRCFFLI